MSDKPFSDLEFIYQALVNVQRLLEKLIKEEKKKQLGESS